MQFISTISVVTAILSLGVNAAPGIDGLAPSLILTLSTLVSQPKPTPPTSPSQSPKSGVLPVSLVANTSSAMALCRSSTAKYRLAFPPTRWCVVTSSTSFATRRPGRHNGCCQGRLWLHLLLLRVSSIISRRDNVLTTLRTPCDPNSGRAERWVGWMGWENYASTEKKFKGWYCFEQS